MRLCPDSERSWLGAGQLLLTAVFALGVAKGFSDGAVLLHGISTVSSHGKYLEPFSSLFFFAASPMLAACSRRLP
ncbi:hypothetical protein KJ059_03030 [Myxococcota bacterium]|nr:hypothetical protein [Myxococcota bacterium]MCZ7618234.1 hypothetical protein [Myxococcota bacterium]